MLASLLEELGLGAMIHTTEAGAKKRWGPVIDFCFSKLTTQNVKAAVSRAERNCTSRAEQNCTTERRGVSIKVSWSVRA